MIFAEERYELKGREILLRSAYPEEAGMLLDYLKTVTGETRFLMCEPDEIKYTIEDETGFVEDHNKSEKEMLILAFVDGEYAGNCSFEGVSGSRRAKHRAGIGIASFQKYTGFGLGRLMLEVLLREIKKMGFEQAELTVIGGNDRAYRLYESLGFRECGRIPNANKYDDGTYSDSILMAVPLK
ncbi:MAG: GNAT family N-acetyltransferase [Lachnospiraceae bacterium]|nr:GNAT family N-acetyltransferase [Lachnospiraceae bacterium]